MDQAVKNGTSNPVVLYLILGTAASLILFMIHPMLFLALSRSTLMTIVIYLFPSLFVYSVVGLGLWYLLKVRVSPVIAGVVSAIIVIAAGTIPPIVLRTGVAEAVHGKIDNDIELTTPVAIKDIVRLVYSGNAGAFNSEDIILPSATMCRMSCLTLLTMPKVKQVIVERQVDGVKLKEVRAFTMENSDRCKRLFGDLIKTGGNDQRLPAILAKNQNCIDAVVPSDRWNLELIHDQKAVKYKPKYNTPSGGFMLIRQFSIRTSEGTVMRKSMSVDKVYAIPFHFGISVAKGMERTLAGTLIGENVELKDAEIGRYAVDRIGIVEKSSDALWKNASQ